LIALLNEFSSPKPELASIYQKQRFMQEQSVSYAAEKAGGILLRPALRDYGGQVAHSIRHHSSSAEFSISTSEDDTFIFYLTESIFFHGDVIRDIGEKGEETERIRSSAHS